MQIVVNGELKTVPDGTTAQQLVEQLGLTDKRIAMERNQSIVPRSQYAETILCEGDRIEIIHAVGGG